MRNLIALSLILAGSSTLANTYQGPWRSSYKVYGPTQVTVTGQNLSGNLHNTLTGSDYPIKGKIVNHVFSGQVKTGGTWVNATGTGFYGVHNFRLDFKVSGVWYWIVGSR